MSRLRDKLIRMLGSTPGQPAQGLGAQHEPAEAPGEATLDVTELLRRRVARLRAARVMVALPEGSEITNERGTCWVRRLVYEPMHRHGCRRLADTRAGRGTLFLDVETTGLAGGAGTVVFLTGIAEFEAERLVLEQVFLRSFAEEGAALQHIAGRLAGAEQLVTFVGKTFDRHRLAARFGVQRIEHRILTLPHQDLYYVARRALRGTIPNTRLRTVERVLLGLERADDLPGSEAPAAFLSWLRDGTGPVDRVLEHNRLDVLSLVALLGCFSKEQLGS